MHFVDLAKQYKTIQQEIHSAIDRVFQNGVYIGGAEVEACEREMANFLHVKHALSVNSGTDALFLALKALEIGAGDEVITTPFTFIATAEVIANIGAKPVFVDIDPHSFNIDPKKIEEKITKKTKAIMPVHLFGQASAMGEIIKIAKQHLLFVIEDACQAIGAEYKGKKLGAIGDIGCFSFFPAKNLGTYGDGGLVVTNNAHLAEKLVLLRNHGSSEKEKYRHLILGTNSRLDAIHAAILRVKLKFLNRWNAKRIEHAKKYTKILSLVPEIILPVTLRHFNGKNFSHVFNQYTIRVKRRDALRKYLADAGIPTMVYYPLPLHLQPAFSYLKHKKGDFPESEHTVREVLSFSIYPELSLKEQRSIIQNIKKFFAK